MPPATAIFISVTQNEAVFAAAAANSLPNHPHRSGLARQALVLVTAKRDESEDEAGESEHEAEANDQDR